MEYRVFKEGRSPSMGNEDEVKQLRDLLTEIKVSIGELKTEMHTVRSTTAEVKEIGKVADRAYQHVQTLEKNLEKNGLMLRWALSLAVPSFISILIAIVGFLVTIFKG